MARLAHDAYYDCMHARYGTSWPRPQQSYQAGKYWRTGFIKLAELCLTEGWEPADYIKSAFDNLTVAHHYIVPTYLLDKRIVERYRQDLALGNGTPENDWKTYVRQLVEFIGNGMSESAVMASPMTPFPAWFRLLYPERLDPRIVELWSGQAKSDFMRDKNLRAFARNKFEYRFRELERVFGKFSELGTERAETCCH